MDAERLVNFALIGLGIRGHACVHGTALFEGLRGGCSSLRGENVADRVPAPSDSLLP